MRYNKIGISTELYKNLLYKGKDDIDYYLDIPKPICDIEFAFLSDFIFGINIGLSTLEFTPRIVECCPSNKTFEKLTVEDYKVMDYDLADISYRIKMPHKNYYDPEFNRAVHPHSYEMDSIIWRSVFSKSYSNSVAVNAYGHCKIYKIDEFYRIKRWYENRNNRLDLARESFIDRIQSLNDLNKKILK